MESMKLVDKLECIQEMANRASFVLGELVCDYGFSEPPNPAKALEFNTGASIEAKQSFQWFLDYSRIYTLIAIASDYVEKIETIASINNATPQKK